ncbi:hypothetical protein RFI_13347 [Reticulomyxa filosa]|uniref:Uncharacterized protein n=1 Tax=Reticulomyxa filosa TaxID=46433 RepID=X6NC00_RETFI|nr:hypothetical protein RFI_13347 [Reticulomyxa filosa]|eukprot:ETO23820.1 hypothetical protein RFI_13347 [Reticulomyxa filosa]
MYISCARAKGITNYPHWFNSSTAYKVKFKPGAEPYVIVKREGLTLLSLSSFFFFFFKKKNQMGKVHVDTLAGIRYDPRFRGLFQFLFFCYGMNKIAHLLLLGYVRRYQFFVLPDSFVITAQHPESVERKLWTNVCTCTIFGLFVCLKRKKVYVRTYVYVSNFSIHSGFELCQKHALEKLGGKLDLELSQNDLLMKLMSTAFFFLTDHKLKFSILFSVRVCLNTFCFFAYNDFSKNKMRECSY